MPADLPYMIAVGNVPTIFDRIREAGTPPKFTHEFLVASLGFTSSQDRGMIKVLKQLGFLASDATPTARYNEYRSAVGGDKALAKGLKEGWAPIFLSDQKAHERSSAQLTETFKSVTGSGEAVAAKMASTFKAIAGKADFSGGAETVEQVVESGATPDATGGSSEDARRRINLHQDVHVHLPPTSDVAVYRAIFQALRDELL